MGVRTNLDRATVIVEADQRREREPDSGSGSEWDRAARGGIDCALPVELEMELRRGPNLRDALAGDLRFDERAARAFLDRMLDILEYLHGFSPPILHRDIKPANILVELPEDGELANAQPVLIDFDTARGIAIDPSAADGTMVGSAGFVPIEQLAGRPVPASDLYGLGMTMIAALSRRELVDLPVERSRLQFHDVVNVSPELKAVLEKMIEPIVEDRFADVAAVRRALAAPPPALATTRTSPPTIAERRARTGVSILVAVAALGGVLAVCRGSRSRSPSAPAATSRSPSAPASTSRSSPPPPTASSGARTSPSPARTSTDELCRAFGAPCEAVVASNAGRFFAQSVAVSGDTLAVGSGTERGGATLFVRQGSSWSEQVALDPPATQAQFGRAVALDGDTLAVGARLANRRFGAVYVYVREGRDWRLQGDLRGPHAESMYGQQLALSGDTLAVNAFAHGGWPQTAAIDLYAREAGAWTLQQRLEGFRHIVSFALDGDTLAVAAPQGTTADPSPAIITFVRAGGRWTREMRMPVTRPPGFASAIALDGDTLAFAASSADAGDRARGEIRVLTRDRGAWTVASRLSDPSAAAPAAGTEEGTRRTFGRELALSKTHLVVTAYTNKPSAEGFHLDHTEVLVFARRGATFELERVIDASQVEAGTIALDGASLALGAARVTAGARERWPGAAFVLPLSPGS